MSDFNMVGFSDPTFKVCNRMKYDIGVALGDGRQYNIKPGSFALLTAREIQYIESICQGKKFFATHMLEVEDRAGNVLPLDELQIVEAPKEERVLTEEEITAMLKKPVKQIEAWIAKIDEPSELHAIYKVATECDLATSKLKVLRARMPEKDWLGDLTE